MKARPRTPAAVLTLGAVAACSLMALVMLVVALRRHMGADANVALLLAIHRYYSPTGGAIAAVVSRVFEPAVVAVVAIAAALLGMRFWRRWAVATGSVAIVATGATLVLKAAFHEVRPHLFAGPISESSYSFPSGHTLLATALFPLLAVGALRAVRNPLGRNVILILALVGPVAIGLDRLYLGVHWPTDVLGGFLAGLACACCGFLALARPDRQPGRSTSSN